MKTITLTAILMVFSSFVVGCGPSAGEANDQTTSNVEDAGSVDSDGTCLPDCEGQECGSDGCGGICGTCPGALHCDWSGVCVEVDCETDSDCLE